MAKLIKGKIKELRGKYGKPLGDSIDIKLEKSDLDRFGELCVKYIVKEAKAAAAYSKSLPKSEEFYNSFGYRIQGSSTVKITSTWDWIEIYQDLQTQGPDNDPAFGKPKPFRMTWATQQKGITKVPLIDKRTGQVVVRSTPLKVADAWIHPGIARHTFINKGMKKAQEEFVKELIEKKLQDVV